MDYLPASLFIKNRYKLKRAILPASIVIASSARQFPRNGDQHFPFRQSSDLYYLTGIKHANCTLVIYPSGGPVTYEEVLYINESDEKSAMWDGPGITVESAKAISGVAEVRPVSNLIPDLKELGSNGRYVYFGQKEVVPDSVIPGNEAEIRRDAAFLFAGMEEHLLGPLMTKIRMYKEPEEIEMMKRAIAITDEAFIRILQEMRPGMMEYEVAALMTYHFLRNGSKEHAFDPIVASGENGLILHYKENRDKCNDGELVLLDFGADWEYYAADISRTIPVNGRYSKRQRELYDATLRVIQKSMKLMKPGIFIKEFNDQVGMLWEEEHVKLGLYTVNDVKRQSKLSPMWKQYYWHGTTHSIGIDVHDRFDHSTPMEAGMVMSCEPGIYITSEGIGIRLENDILITENGAVNLSDNIPIDPDAIEVIMNKARA